MDEWKPGDLAWESVSGFGYLHSYIGMDNLPKLYYRSAKHSSYAVPMPLPTCDASILKPKTALYTIFYKLVV